MPRYVTVEKFAADTGYSANAVRCKIKEGKWLRDVMWRKAPDNRILIDLDAYALWVENQLPSDPLRTAQSKSTSTTRASATARG